MSLKANADIRYIVAHPGHYALMLSPHRDYFMVEVAADGTIHQLTPQGQRDGILRAEGPFHPDVRAYVVSDSGKTFVRVPADAPEEERAP